MMRKGPLRGVAAIFRFFLSAISRHLNMAIKQNNYLFYSNVKVGQGINNANANPPTESIPLYDASIGTRPWCSLVPTNVEESGRLGVTSQCALQTAW